MDEKELIYRIWLSELPAFGPLLSKNLLDHFRSAERVYNASVKDLTRVNGIGRLRAEILSKIKDLDRARQIYEDCNKKGISIISSSLIHHLSLLPDLPSVLYIRGHFNQDIFSKTAGVVGARECTRATRDITIRITERLCLEGNTIISGMARGVDSYAHTRALKEGSPTIAVLGCGPDICYPPEHITLMKKIIETGLIMSQFPPGTKPSSFTFPARNRIIAALSDTLTVTGARKKSGSLITAGNAALYGKKVYAFTGSTDDPDYAGCRDLVERGIAEEISFANNLIKT